MKLLVPKRLIDKLRSNLRGRRSEIGGILVGEHIEGETFRLSDISFQLSGGNVVHFIRDPAHHKDFLQDFFDSTGRDYDRFNYIGEWHSHPSFEPLPSGEDIATMFDILANPNVGVNFGILIIARLGSLSRVELSATLFQTGIPPKSISVAVEDDQELTRPSLLDRLIRFFTGG